MPMPKEQFARVEEQLRQYPFLLMDIIEAREQAVNPPSPGERVGKGYGVPDPTYSTAARLCSREIMRLERVADAIDATYKAVGEELRQLIRLYYWRRERLVDVAYFMQKDEDTLRFWRHIICGAVAWRMGKGRNG